MNTDTMNRIFHLVEKRVSIPDKHIINAYYVIHSTCPGYYYSSDYRIGRRCIEDCETCWEVAMNELYR